MLAVDVGVPLTVCVPDSDTEVVAVSVAEFVAVAVAERVREPVCVTVEVPELDKE
jgi:hypothetical protein